MDIIQISNEIQNKIKNLQERRGRLKEYGEKKSLSIANYEKELAKTIIGLKNGRAYQIDDVEILNPQVTIIEKIAKGICWQEKLNMEKEETLYKSLIVSIDCLQAELCALQSLNRHLD